MTSYDMPENQRRSSSNRYTPVDYYNQPSSPLGRSSQSYFPSGEQQPRPYTPPSPAQYNASPGYRAPLDHLRPPNPDVQAVQMAEGYGRRPSQSRERRPSHISMNSHHSHRSHRSDRAEDERPAHERRPSHRSHRSSHSGQGSHHRKSSDVPYRTESERAEYIKQLKRIDSRRPTLGGSLLDIWDALKKSLAK